MKREQQDRPEDWQTTNPGYERSKPTQGRINGEPVVSVEASTLWDYARDQAIYAKSKRRPA